MAATITMTVEGLMEAASADALALLGVTLPELRSLPRGAFSPEPPDPAADEAFRAEWEAQGRPQVGGRATLQRPDGSKVRVRFAITSSGDGRLLAVLEPVDEPLDAPRTIYTAGDVLSAWRAAERRLQALVEGGGEWAAVTAEIEELRGRYQQLFRQALG